MGISPPPSHMSCMLRITVPWVKTILRKSTSIRSQRRHSSPPASLEPSKKVCEEYSWMPQIDEWQHEAWHWDPFCGGRVLYHSNTSLSTRYPCWASHIISGTTNNPTLWPNMLYGIWACHDTYGIEIADRASRVLKGGQRCCKDADLTCSGPSGGDSFWDTGPTDCDRGSSESYIEDGWVGGEG